MKILVIEDDEKISSFIARGLKENGYIVDTATDGLTGQVLAEEGQYDAIVADIMLPGRDGLKVIQELRAKNKSVPVIFLSAKSSVEDRIAGLQAGGDDYLGKPFAISELTARIQALIRRATVTTAPSEPTVLSHGDLTLNLLTREVHRAGQKSSFKPENSLFSNIFYGMQADVSQKHLSSNMSGIIISTLKLMW
jgi:two-component system OmpR family response regulator